MKNSTAAFRIKGLGRDFVFCIDDAIQEIQKDPFIYSIYFKEFRRGFVRRFPYGTFYISDDNRISVVRVFNLCQSPKGIQGALK